MIKSLDEIKCSVDVRDRDACDSLASRQRGSVGGIIKSLQQKGILDGFVKQMKMALSLLCVEVDVLKHLINRFLGQ